MTEPIPISQARKNLARLFDIAVRVEGRKIEIACRGQKRRAVLVSAAYVEGLEAKAHPRPTPKPRPKGISHIAGTMKIIGDPDTVLFEVRARQAALEKAKWEKFLRDSRGPEES